MTLCTPTIVDDTLAPPGRHVVNVFGGHAPYKLKNGDWGVEKERFKKTVLNSIDNYAPGFSGDVIAEQTLVPPDLEAIVGLPQGHIFHGELSADQLFFQRPVSGYADYRTPVKGAVSLWILDPSGRRCVRHSGSQRRAGDPQGYQGTQNLKRLPNARHARLHESRIDPSGCPGGSTRGTSPRVTA